MASQREDDESDESREDDADSESGETDDDEPGVDAAEPDSSDEEPDDDADDEDDRPDDGRILTRPEDDPNQQQTIEPRNRAERRAARRREKLPEGRDRNAEAIDRRLKARGGATGSTGRVRLPPRTATGKTNVDDVPMWAKSTVSWFSQNRSFLAIATLFVVVVVGGTLGWYYMRQRKNAQAADALAQAILVEIAPIRAADAPPDPESAPPRRGPTFPDRAARSRAAVRAFHDVSERFPRAPIAPLAQLSEATSDYDLGRYADARRVFQGLIGKDLAGQEGRLYEGLGFTLEALNDLPGALHQFESLGTIQDGAWHDASVYHQARVQQRLGHGDRAKDLLHGLIERLRRSNTEGDETPAAGGNGSILEQSQSLLRDIDPEDPLAETVSAAVNGRDPDTLRRLFEQHMRGAAPGTGAQHLPTPIHLSPPSGAAH